MGLGSIGPSVLALGLEFVCLRLAVGGVFTWRFMGSYKVGL